MRHTHPTLRRDLEHKSDTTHETHLLSTLRVEDVPLLVEQVGALHPNGEELVEAVTCSCVQVHHIAQIVNFEQWHVGVGMYAFHIV